MKLPVPLFTLLFLSCLTQSVALPSSASSSPPEGIEESSGGMWGDDGSDDDDGKDCKIEFPDEVRPAKPRPTIHPCANRGTSVVAYTWLHSLYLCEAGRIVDEFDMAIGRGGIFKRREGDHKTPIGVYPLGQPTPSAKFGTFIPIGYPTDTEKRDGYTGSAIGIHGPDRRFRCAGMLNIKVDWTAGCMAVATDDFVETVARFVQMNPEAKIHIIDDAPRRRSDKDGWGASGNPALSHKTKIPLSEKFLREMAPETSRR